GEAVSLPRAGPFGLEDAVAVEVSQVVRQHARRQPWRVADPAQLHARVRDQTIVDPATALQFKAFQHPITAAARGRARRGRRGSGRATPNRWTTRPPWPSRRATRGPGSGRWRTPRSRGGSAARDVERTIARRGSH